MGSFTLGCSVIHWFSHQQLLEYPVLLFYWSFMTIEGLVVLFYAPARLLWRYILRPWVMHHCHQLHIKLM